MARLALLIGISEYESGLSSLPSAVRDVESIQRVLQNPNIGNFAASDIATLVNPKKEEMEAAIYRLFTDRKKDDLLIFYFSGHGITDERGNFYFSTRSTQKNNQGRLIPYTAIAARYIHDLMEDSRSKGQIIILDCCFSAAFAEGLSIKADSTVDIWQQLGGEGRAILASSTSTEYSFAQEGEDLSLYTRFLIEGIETGKADQDEDEFISVDELHEYAKQKVLEINRGMKPGIFASRDGFKLRLARVPPVDPKQRYRKEVTRFLDRGEVSLIGRRTLDILRTRLQLGAAEAKAIEDEILEPYRREFQENLHRYEQIFTEILQREETIRDVDREQLHHLQQILGLRNEDTIPIEAKVTTQFRCYKENLQTYAQTFQESLRQERPLSETKRRELRRLQQRLELADTDIAQIESQITADVETYYQNLKHYQQTFAAAIRQEYPLNEAKHNQLKTQQQTLGLTDVDVAPIEAQITTEIKTYQQKIQQYQQAFIQATHRKHYPNEVNREQLRQTWQTLGLNEADVVQIEAQIMSQVEAHQTNLRQYEQEFTNAVQQQYPLSQARRNHLQQQQQTLRLTDEDIAPIESQITSVIEEHLQKLQQYEQVLTEAIQYEYPISDATRNDLDRFQTVLDLSNEDAKRIEVKLLRRRGETTQSNVSQTSAQPESIREVVVPEPEVYQPASTESIPSNTPTNSTNSQRTLQLNSTVAPTTSQKPKFLIGGGIIATLTAISIAFFFDNRNEDRPAQTSEVPSPPATQTSEVPSSPLQGNITLSGAGASFPAPLYQRWFADYHKENPNVQISYQRVGSGAGVEQFLAGTVDFGASDTPLKDEEQKQFQQKYGAAPIQVPATSGALVFAYNLEGIDKLKLSRNAYCGIVTGEITNWNDPAIAAGNQGARLPDEPIQFVHRSDGSGTTFLFTNHLTAACPNWQAGANKSVEWPAGTGAKGNEGVTAQIQQTPGAIGYVESAYAKENGLNMAAIENKSGNIATLSPETAANAFTGAEVPTDFALLVPDPANPQAYPIVGLTWMLFYPTYQDAAKAEAIKQIVTYGLTNGKQAALDLGYFPIDDELTGKVKAEVSKIQ